MSEKISIGTASEILGVNVQTLRRWDEEGVLKSHRSKTLAHRYYTEEKIEDFLSNNYKYLEKVCKEWVFNDIPTKIPFRFHCLDKSIFKARLSKLESLLARDKYLGVDYKFSLITSVIGEIGNNSFDHNIGNWADERGVFFGYNLNERKIILADRGQGLLTTLKRVKTELSTDQEALNVAFTEYVSGRAPESRGNGLKYVREIVEGQTEEMIIENLNLYFQSGDAKVLIEKNGDNLNIKKADNYNRGCFAILSY
jgi:hypothetical protein